MSAPQSSSPGSEDAWLIVKRGLYFRPDCKGYTGIKDEAGRYSYEFAKDYDRGECKIIRETDGPEFMPDAYDDLVIKHLTKQRDELRAEVERLNGAAQAAPEPLAWRWNTRADQRWRVTIKRPIPNDLTAFDKIEPLYAASPAPTASGGDAVAGEAKAAQKDEMLAFFLAFFEGWPADSKLTLTDMEALDRARAKVAAMSRSPDVAAIPPSSAGSTEVRDMLGSIPELWGKAGPVTLPDAAFNAIAAKFTKALEDARITAPAQRPTDAFIQGVREALIEKCVKAVRYCGECDCPRMSVDAMRALGLPSTQLCPNGLEHGNCLHPNCVSSCPGRLSLSSPNQSGAA